LFEVKLNNEFFYSVMLNLFQHLSIIVHWRDPETSSG